VFPLLRYDLYTWASCNLFTPRPISCLIPSFTPRPIPCFFGLTQCVHRKTWTKDGDPSLFWPKEWLPRDHDFRDVRIHTFGYDANWNKESILNIHDFAKDLLSWLKDSPAIPRENSVSANFKFRHAPEHTKSM